MNNTMTAKEYQQQVVRPAMEEETGDRDFMVAVLKEDKKIKPARKNEEDVLTKQVTNYLEGLRMSGKVKCYSHIPSSTYTESWSQKNKNKAMGVRPGVPDMLIVTPDRVLFLELKKEKGGVVSIYQKEWIEAINYIAKGTAYAQGISQVVAKVAHGWDEAKQEIDWCLPD